MSRLGPTYPERIYSSSKEEQPRSLGERMGQGKISTGWMIAGLAALGVGAWMVYHFGPDFVRYMKMEKM